MYLVNSHFTEMNGLFDEEGNLSSVTETRAMIAELQQENTSGKRLLLCV